MATEEKVTPEQRTTTPGSSLPRSTRRPASGVHLAAPGATISPETPFPPAPAAHDAEPRLMQPEQGVSGLRRPTPVRQSLPPEAGGSDLAIRLVAAGRDALAEGGLHALTLRDAARRCGVSHGAPRRYFPTQTAFLGALAADISADLATELQAYRHAPRDLARAYVTFAGQRPAEYGLLVRHDIPAVKALGDKESAPSIVSLWVSAYRNLYPTSDSHHVIAAWAAIQGLATLASHRALNTATVSLDSLLTVVLRRPGTGRV